MNSEIKIFNRERKKVQQERAAKKFHNSSFLFDEVAERIAGQFGEIIKKPFEKVLILGTKNSHLANLLKQNKNIGEVFEADLAISFLQGNNTANLINCDEELLPFKNESFDLILSNLTLHWVNDLVGSLIQIKNILKKDGMFLATLFGSKTLMELRHSLMQAESEKGASPRISPFIDVREGAALMQRAGFKEPLAITEEIDVKYESAYQLMYDLRNMGETNALIKLNNKFPDKFFFNEVERNYFENFSDEQNLLNAKFEIVSISGWKV